MPDNKEETVLMSDFLINGSSETTEVSEENEISPGSKKEPTKFPKFAKLVTKCCIPSGSTDIRYKKGTDKFDVRKNQVPRTFYTHFHRFLD